MHERPMSPREAVIDAHRVRREVAVKCALLLRARLRAVDDEPELSDFARTELRRIYLRSLRDNLDSARHWKAKEREARANG